MRRQCGEFQQLVKQLFLQFFFQLVVFIVEQQFFLVQQFKFVVQR
jgi:hypothetical protein